MLKSNFSKKVMSVLLCAAMFCCVFTAFPSAKEAYTPNREIVISNQSDTGGSARIALSALPFNLGENGPYHVVAQIKVEKFSPIDAAEESAFLLRLKYGNYDDAGAVKAADKEVEAFKLTKNTNGYITMANENTTHIEIENFDTDLIMEFSLKNVACDVSIADLIIADKDNAIVYSLANDSTLSGVTNLFGSYGTLGLWQNFFNSKNASVSLKTKENAYVPNRVLSVDIPNTYGASKDLCPEGNAYTILDMGKFPVDKGPYTLSGMFKVENYAVNTFDEYAGRAANAGFFFLDMAIRPIRGNTDGWIPLVQENGKPYSFAGGSGWKNIIGSWATTGKMSIADLVIVDKDGAAVLDFATYEGLEAKDYNWRTTIGAGEMLLWAYDMGLGKYSYSIAEEPIEHNATDYELKQFEETYTPVKAPIIDPPVVDPPVVDPPVVDPPKEEKPTVPPTGDTSTSALLIVAATAIMLSGTILVVKKVKAK